MNAAYYWKKQSKMGKERDTITVKYASDLSVAYGTKGYALFGKQVLLALMIY